MYLKYGNLKMNYKNFTMYIICVNNEINELQYYESYVALTLEIISR